MKLRKFALAPIAAAAMAFSIPVAADTLYNINIGNLTGNGLPDPGLGWGTGPYATANVHLIDGDDATVTFNSLTNGGYIYLMGGNGAAAVNVNATSWTIGSFASTELAGFTKGALSSGGANNEDGFGSFNQTVDSFDGFTNSHTQISFSLHRTDSGTWANSASVLAGNASGYRVAIHGFACSSPGCTKDSGAAFTGYAVNAIPEPETYAMMLVGFGLLGFVARRRKQTFGNVVPA